MPSVFSSERGKRSEENASRFSTMTQLIHFEEDGGEH